MFDEVVVRESQQEQPRTVDKVGGFGYRGQLSKFNQYAVNGRVMAQTLLSTMFHASCPFVFFRMTQKFPFPSRSMDDAVVSRTDDTTRNLFSVHLTPTPRP